MITPRDWEEVKALFHEALERPPDERARFVRDRTDNDAVRREVESLLSVERAAEGFLSTPPAASDLDSLTPRLSLHSRLGPFEILELLGAGGMGEVYRARDTRLDRTVAIKVLSRDFVAHPQGRDRLEREARAISKLIHPHVCLLLDVGDAQVAGVDTQFLVMELLEGETLATRLQRGALPVNQAVKTGLEILDALSAAHSAGIVHRDLKPGNIMLTRSGVKLLDFGLARFRPQSIGKHSLETATGDVLTAEGILVGTAPYMSPEQLKGDEADARSDVFAFGAVLYEMITGVRAFGAGSRAEVVAAILEHDPPPLTSRQPLAPPALDRIVATCLAKDPDDRWPRARDVQRELHWMGKDASDHHVAAPVNQRTNRRRWWLWAGGAAALALTLLAVLPVWRESPPPSRVSFPILPPKGTTFQRATAEMSFSPDGDRLAFVALSADGARRLWVRRIDAIEARMVEGTDGALYPFWSPDGRSLGFFARAKLVRVEADGNSRQELGDARFPRGASWSREGTILFGANAVLQRIAASGGAVVPVTGLDESRKERAHSWPAFLPDGRRFLFVSLGSDGRQASIYQGSLDSKETHRVLPGATSFALVGNRLLSVSQRALMMQNYDADRAQVSGAPIELARGIGVDVRTAHGAFAVASDSVLAYRVVGDQSRLTWYDRNGRALGSFREPGDYQHPWLSPDDKQVAVEKTDPSTGRHTVWILDVARDVASKLLVDPSGAHGPVWAPDGSRIAFLSNRVSGGIDAFSMRADGTGDQTLLIPPVKGGSNIPTDWSLDGRLVLYDAEHGGQRNLWIQPVSPAGQAVPFLETNAFETQGQFSPDVRWIAYTSDESGVPEVYVRRYPDGGGKWRVSTNGGAQPRWRRDGKELFYLAADGNLMAADVQAHATAFETGPPHVLFDTGIRGLFVDRRNHYVVTRDGQRFLVNVTAEDDNLAPITVVLNWDSAIVK